MSESVKNEAVSSTLRKGINEGEYLLKRFRKKLREFEEKYNMETETFTKKFEAGALDDREEFFEWKSINESVKHWEQKIRELKKVT